jgi:hypothetical protein
MDHVSEYLPNKGDTLFAAHGDQYAAVYLRAGERAALTTIVTLIDPVVISLDRYVATTGFVTLIFLSHFLFRNDHTWML